MNVEQEIAELQATTIPNRSSCTRFDQNPYPSPGRGERVVLIDYGMKHGILRELNNRDCDVIVVPYNTSTKEILFFIPRWHCVIKWTWESKGC